MRYLIVNADDFGFTRGVNAGILETHQRGVVTSATIQANARWVEDAITRAIKTPTLGIGCHLTLIGGPALAESDRVPHLVDREGRLPRSWPELLLRFAGGLRIKEIELEFSAQLDRLYVGGLRLTHVDTHKHTHLLPPVLEAALRSASDFGIRAIRNPIESRRSSGPGPQARITRDHPLSSQSLKVKVTRLFSPTFRQTAGSGGFRFPGHFYGVTQTGKLTPSLLREIAASIPEGISELMCHPGRGDEDLASETTRLKSQREDELRALTDPSVRETIRDLGIELIDYRAFAQNE